MKVNVKLYDGCRYDINSEKIAEMEYDIEYFDIIHAENDPDIEKNYAEDERDPYDEYLVLHLENGETATFRNNRVDLFVIYS